MSFEELVLYGFELCGRYARFPEGDELVTLPPSQFWRVFFRSPVRVVDLACQRRR